jgi:protein O-mannosyl-transferase
VTLYWRVFGAPFVYDDLDQIVNNPYLGSFHATFKTYFLSPAGFTTHFTGVGGSNFRPLFWLSLSVDRHVWGLNPSGFHFTNVILHWLNGFLLFVVLRRFGVAAVIAATTSFIWLAMPINSEVVAWVSGRAYLLCVFFLILALWSARTYLLEQRNTFLVCVFACSLAALCCHESGILILPLVVLSAWGMKRLLDRSAGILISVVLMSDGLFWVVRRLVGTRTGGGGPAIWQVGLTFWKYVLWTVLPVHMSIERATSTPPNMYSPAAVAALGGVAALCVGIVLLRRRAPQIAVGLAWSTLTTLPFCGVVFIYQGMAERYMYFASAGVALAIASLVFQHTAQLKQIVASLAILWVGWGAWRLKARVADWCDPLLLYQSSVQTTPDPVLFYNLGWAWREKGNLDNALTAYQEATRLRPNYEQAQASVGQVLGMLGRPQEAVIAYNKALALRPEDSATRVDLAVAIEQLGNRQEAEAEFRKSLAAAPASTPALNGLGSLLLIEGKPDEAIPLFQQAIHEKPSDTTAYYDLAVLYQQQGQVANALEFYGKVLEINPNDQGAIANAAMLSGSR